MRGYSLLFLLSVLFLCSCEGETGHTLTYRVVERLTSPDGCCIAEVTEAQFEETRVTGLNLEFTEYGGGFGAVTFRGVGLDLKLRWIDSENLEIRFSDDVSFLGNQYGNSTVTRTGNTTVERVQFYKRVVNLLLVPVSADDGA